MKCWNCCAQSASTTVAIDSNVQSSACASPRHRRVVSRAGTEKIAMPVEEGAERTGDVFDQRYGRPSSAHTVT